MEWFSITKRWILIASGLMLIVILVGYKQSGSRPKQRVLSICASVTPNQQAEALSFVSKMDGGYMVYVKPAWYTLRMEQKQAVAAYIARCKLSGAARFLDSSTAKLLARWGENGYVDYEQNSAEHLQG